MTTLAYTPFIDPIQAHDIWFLLLIPLAFLIAVGYKAVRTVNMRHYWRQVLMFTVQIVGGIVLLGLGAYLIIAYAIPSLAPMPGT
ncbi:MAG: hypothetical protein ACIARR_10245 [Phycisphaerales bacterium JB059]